MARDRGSDEPDEVFVCVWCGGKVLPWEVRAGRNPVCRRCTRLLLDANLSDEEIYGGEDRRGQDSEPDR